MPEGPEVRTLVDQLQPSVGRRLVDIRFLSGRYVRHDLPKGFLDFRDTMKLSYDPGLGKTDVVKEWNAKGKFIYLILESEGHEPKKQNNEGNDKDISDDYLRSIWITLGMSGRFINDSVASVATTIGKEPRWYMEYLDLDTMTTRKIYYQDTRNFGTIRFSLSRKELVDKLKKLGPDILTSTINADGGNESTLDRNSRVGGDDGDNRTGNSVTDENYEDDGSVNQNLSVILTEDEFLKIVEKEMTRKKRGSMKTNICRFLMDQTKISGVGNYILAEGLYRANVDPFASLDEISPLKLSSLYQHLREVAISSYKAGGTTRPKGGSFRDVNGMKGSFEFQLQCYGRERCPLGRKVIRDTDGPHGRTIWYVEDQLVIPRAARLSNINNAAEMKEGERTVSGIEKIGQKAYSPPPTEIDSTSKKELAQYFKKDSDWHEFLYPHLISDGFCKLSQTMTSERSSFDIYPPISEVFAAFNACPLSKTKVVIVGQDPYHGPGQAHGLSFSVRRGTRIPPSLRNILKELSNDIGVGIPTHGCLDCWANQGVLLLNSVLTVQASNPGSHSRMGWEDFTDEVIGILNQQFTDKGGLVFLLWGAAAAKKAQNVDRDKHVVITTSHPSPLGATKTSSPFLGSKCFTQCNEALLSLGKEPIDWDLC